MFTPGGERKGEAHPWWPGVKLRMAHRFATNEFSVSTVCRRSKVPGRNEKIRRNEKGEKQNKVSKQPENKSDEEIGFCDSSNSIFEYHKTRRSTYVGKAVVVGLPDFC
jgi:hypothetical protein